MAVAESEKVADFVKRIPAPHEIKERLVECNEEAKLLRQMLRLSMQRDKARGAPSS